MPKRAPPTLSLFFEGPTLAPSTKLGEWDLKDYFSGLESTKLITHDRSFGVLRVLVQCSENSHLQLIVDGKYVPLTSFGGGWVAGIPLSYDIEFHRIAVLARPRLALTLDVEVEHKYLMKGGPSGAAKSLSKWSKDTYEAELLKLSQLFDSRKQIGVMSESLTRGLSIGKEENLSEALLQTCGRLSIRLETASLSEMRGDFNVLAPGEIDREGLLSLIKEDSRRLIRSPTGSIRSKGERYTTIVNARHEASGNLVDLAPVLATIQTAEHLLKDSSCPAPIIGMLSEVAADIEHYCRPVNAAAIDISNFLEKPMCSAFGIDVQGLCRQLILLVTNQLGRDKREHGIFWLKRAIRDFDVFETAVFVSCASAFGFSDNEILGCRNGVLERPGITVADANTKQGRKVFETSLRGWRESSSQPASYRPDTFIILNGSRPILIDAKFRIGSSFDMLAHPDGIKDVQAYLDDFDLNGAVVVVPRILNTALCMSPGLALIQSTDGRGNHRVIAVVELQQSGDLLTLANMKKAVELVAATASH